MTPTEARSARFRVSARVRGMPGWCKLIVAPGSLTLKSGILVRLLTGTARVVHKGTYVKVLRPRLIPFRTYVVLEGDHEDALAQVPGYRRRELFAALAAAGFIVSERRTWVAMGYDEIRRA